MPAQPAITRFTDEELARAPGFADRAITATIEALSRPSADIVGMERLELGRIAVGVAAVRPRMTADYCASLRVQLQALRRGTTVVPPQPTAAAAGVKLSLALVDEREVASEVEINRVAHEIRSAAEHELRELRAYLSALCGESHVDQNHIELDATQHARAFWAAAQLLGAEPGWPAQLMRHGAKPLAQGLRRSWAAATTRLEEAGVQAAAYRTLVLPAGMRTTFGGPVVDSRALHAMARSVQRIEESLHPRAPAPWPSDEASRPPATMPVPVPAPLQVRRTEVDMRPARVTPAPTHTRDRASDNAPAEPRQADAVATVAQILDLLNDDPRITPDLKPIVMRLRQPILKLAKTDPLILTDDEHAAWRFIDRIAWQSSTLPPPPDRERVRTAQVIAGLADQACKSLSSGAETFQWALERLIVLERNRHERRAARHVRQAQSLAAVEQQLLTPGRSSGSDHTQLPTVPADLYDTLPAALAEIPPADAWLESLSMGSIARLLMRGRWVYAELLWRSPQRELWLWGDCRSDEVWPVRRGALRMLFQGKLATTAIPDTVVREAAHRLAERAARTTTSATALA